MKLHKEDRVGLYFTITVHLAILVVALAAGLGYSLGHESSFVLDFTKMEELEKMQRQMESLQKEIELKEAISRKLEQEIGEVPAVRNVAVNRSALKDDRGTDAEQLYKDAERLQKELSGGYELNSDEDYASINKETPDKSKKQEKETYSGPSVVSYSLDGRKASRLPIPAYRCMGAGRVTVLITVSPSGDVLNAKIDEAVSSSDACLRAFAVRAARLSKFSASPSAPPKQAGNIVYEFVAQ